MAEKRVIELEIQDNVKSLKTQYKEAVQEVQRLANTYGTTSKEAAEAAKRAAELKDRIEESKSLTDAFNPDAKFNALSSSIGGVLNGFQAYEGAMGLMGVESEALQETLLKVQSAMALSQGIQGILEAKDSFMNLGSVVKNTFAGMTTAGKAFAVTGIGLLVAGIGVLISVMGKLSAKEKEYAEARRASFDESIDTFEKESELALARAQLQGKSQREQIEMQIAQEKQKNKMLQKQAKEEYRIYEELYEDDWGSINDATKEAYDKHVELIKQSNESTHKINKLQIELEKEIKAKADEIKNKEIEETKKRNEEAERLAKERSNKAKQQRDSDLSELSGYITEANKLYSQSQMDDTEKAIDEIKRRYAEQIRLAKKYNKGTAEIEIAMMNEINDIHLVKVNEQIQQENAAREQANKNKITLENEFLDAIANLEEDNYQRTLSDIDKEKLAVNDKYFELETKAQGNAEALAVIQIAKLNELNDINLKYDEIDKQRQDAKDAEDKKKLIARTDLALKYAKTFTDAYSSLNGLLNASDNERLKKVQKGSKEEENIKRRMFKRDKALRISQTVVDTASNIVTSVRNGGGVPTGIPFGIAAGAMGALQIAAIAKAKFDGGDNGTQNAPDATAGTNVSAPQFNTIGSSGINQLAQLQMQPVQAYVVSGQVTSAQALDRNRIQNSSL